MSDSLAQHVAKAGGIAIADIALQGELDRLRDVNTLLRGKNAILRRYGRPMDVVAVDCMDAGYPVNESNFLEALETDARAWANRSDRDRVWIDYELTEALTEMYDAEYEAWLMESATVPRCQVCDAPTAHPTACGPDTLCPDCAQWAQILTGEVEGCGDLPLEDVVQYEIHAALALYDAITNFL